MSRRAPRETPKRPICPAGKPGYRTAFDAKIVLARLQGKAAALRHAPEFRRAEGRFYRCPHCHLFHMTSQRRRTGADRTVGRATWTRHWQHTLRSGRG